MKLYKLDLLKMEISSTCMKYIASEKHAKVRSDMSLDTYIELHRSVKGFCLKSSKSD